MRSGNMKRVFLGAALICAALSGGAQAADCPVAWDRLAAALKASVKPAGGPGNGGFDNHMWASVVARDGAVCAVAFSGAEAGDQWPGSRAISAEKANTANSVSVDAMALSSGNLYAGALSGGPFYGLEATHPPATDVLYGGDAAAFGTASDPMVGKVLGGVVVFGGGLALYDGNGVVGGLGVSGDSSCADHNVVWRVRAALKLDQVPAGVAGERKDGLIYDLNHENKSASGFGHPKCLGTEAEIGAELGASVGGESLK
jgi:uncharacterized protein GlcG (DUF336 family)